MSCPPVEDAPLSRYKGSLSVERLGRVFPIDPQTRFIGSMPASGRCPNCSFESSKLVCPECHNELPSQFGQFEEYPIALVGARESGKSNYIGVVVHELRIHFASDFDAPISSRDEQTRRRYKERYERPLFDESQAVPATVSAATEIENRYPLSYRLDITQPGLFGREQHKVVGLSFFDSAGEDLSNIDNMSVQNRYIAHARGLLVLLDPLQIDAVRDQVGQNTPLPTRNPHQDDILERVTQLTYNTLHIAANRKIEIPLAVVFSKTDTLVDALDPSLLRASNHPGYVDLSEIDQSHDLLRAYLQEWGHTNLIKQLESRYKQWRLFGASALGGSPEKQNYLPRGVNPFRVLDPILWLLYTNKVLVGRRRQA